MSFGRRLVAACMLLAPMAFLAGALWVQSERIAASAPAAVPASAENWGLSFPEEGQTPVGNATAEELAQYDVWCAQYGSTCTCPLPYGMWQYSSKNPLGIPGFGNSLDCNNVYKDYPSIIQHAELNGWIEPEDDGGSDDSAKLQRITVGPLSSGDVATLKALCEQLQLVEMGLYKEG